MTSLQRKKKKTHHEEIVESSTKGNSGAQSVVDTGCKDEAIGVLECSSKLGGRMYVVTVVRPVCAIRAVDAIGFWNRHSDGFRVDVWLDSS